MPAASPSSTPWGELMNLRIKFQNALQDYNNAHPGNPLKDENGVLVEF